MKKKELKREKGLLLTLTERAILSSTPSMLMAPTICRTFKKKATTGESALLKKISTG